MASAGEKGLGTGSVSISGGNAVAGALDVDAGLAPGRSDILSPATQPDFVLLERIGARDAAAVGELYDRHSRLLYGLILRILRDRGEAEEILQEVFVLV